MNSNNWDFKNVKTELKFTTARSSGPGGQNVNKVSSKVIVRWNIAESTALTDSQKELVVKKLAGYITLEGDLVIASQESRSQIKNKELVMEKLQSLLTKAFTKPKPRRATKPTVASKTKRMESKKKMAEKKQMRKKLY